jgi:hypothetical protein
MPLAQISVDFAGARHSPSNLGMGAFLAHTALMNLPTAILLGLIVCAASAAILLRWDLSAGTAGVVKVDRWTGAVYRCFNGPNNTGRMTCE